MHRFKTSLFALVAFALTAPLLTGCVGGGGYYARSPGPRRVIVVERRAHVWIPGHWVHRPGARVWVGGYWR